ncbi:unnamed protein product [Plutella xylostella]|uniref:(diamondback moth) hypothetical protein n=1 Tax=Plutella xylostella TaxID=51655 RepID=A0A8S4FKW1_PLUXY|nr:unnamed protein product [Plutella xylostella]
MCGEEIPISPAEALDLFETLVRRLCALPTEQRPLTLEQPDQLPDYLFQLAQFQPADSVQLPAGYTVPPLAISALYWRCWCALVMLCAHSPGVAHAAAQRYPTLRALIDAAITDKPSIEWSGASAAEAEAERSAILQLEGHLAAASHGKLPVTEHNCRLLSQLTTLDPLGPARKPPAGVLEAFQQQASSLRLGALLCRQPALLLELVQRHGTRRAMPWLHQLLQQDQLQLSVLPVQCLCEFLSGGGAWAGAARGEQLAAHLRRTVADSGAGALAVLQYYTQRLAHQHRATRAQANRGLKLVLTQAPEDGSEVDYNEDVDPMEWIEALYTLPHWESVRSTVISHVLVACLAECRARAVAAYVACLARHVRDTPEEDHDQLILGMSQLIMERGTIVNNMLPAPGAPPAPAQHQALLHLTSIFHHHLHKVRVRDTTDPSAASDSAEGADALTVRWAGWSARMHTTQAHAHLKLLCYGPSNLDTEHMYDWLETTWSEAAGPPELLPDWLRLHLVRCARPTLLALGLRDVSPMKLALFIQTFGVPVPAVTALLQALDQCPASSVARIGVERAYMSLLLRVQRGRGARGGQAFAAAARLAPAEPIPGESRASHLHVATVETHPRQDSTAKRAFLDYSN